MAKQYADAGTYEAKLEKVMGRFGAEQYNYDWSRRACWVEFWYKGQYYRFEHSVDNAIAHGQNIQYGSDVFAQVVLTLEDIARMTERGIYELQVWIAGLKALPPPAPIPECFAVLQFDKTPTRDDVERRFKQLCKIAHPDVGGSEEMFQRIVNAREQALKLLEERPTWEETR